MSKTEKLDFEILMKLQTCVLKLQETFVSNILSSGIEVHLSKVWLSEVYRLVTTYDILSKAGFKQDSPESNQALICILSDSFYINSNGRINDPGTTSKFVTSNVVDVSNQTPAVREGIKFARKLLLTTWDAVLEILGLPLDTSTKIIGKHLPRFVLYVGCFEGLKIALFACR